LVARGAAALYTGVALGDIDVPFLWHAWHLWGVTSTYLLWQAWYLRHWAGSGGALHRVAGMVLGDVDIPFAWQAWHLRHWAGPGGGLDLGSRLGAAAFWVAGGAW